VIRSRHSYSSADARRLRLSATLGVDAGHRARLHAQNVANLSIAAARLDAALPPACTALVTGHSGAGKSTLLASLARRCGPSAVIVRPLSRDADRVNVAALCPRLPLDRWASLLARFGLADAGVLLGKVRDLSAGERARLAVAHAAARAERLLCGCHYARLCERSAVCRDARIQRTKLPKQSLVAPASACPPLTLIADEWCSLLDDATARGIAHGASRWTAEHNVRLICATARSGPVLDGVDLLITLDGTGEKGGVRWTVCGSNAAA
jgi:ABC-type glutathione transport system ATPase component